MAPKPILSPATAMGLASPYRDRAAARRAEADTLEEGGDRAGASQGRAAAVCLEALAEAVRRHRFAEATTLLAVYEKSFGADGLEVP